jgi:C1A family cysteine protease
MAVPTKPVLHKRYAPIWDQGSIGSCVGNAVLGSLSSHPHWRWWQWWRRYAERDAVSVYSAATKIDDFAGEYPPDDTGTSFLDAARVLQRRGWIKSYQWAFGLNATLSALAVKPVCIGINWYSSFMEPGASGVLWIAPDAVVEGGHEVVLIGVDPIHQTVRLANSWGTSWGDRGFGVMSYDTLDQLLSEQGDAGTFAL